MRNVRAPTSDAPPLTRSVVACLASILELEIHDVPSPDGDAREPWTRWSNWLGRRGLDLVPVLEPSTFGWPGPWLALLRVDDQGRRVGVIAFGSPPGVIWDPLETRQAFSTVEAGYVIAPADLSQWALREVPDESTAGVVQAIALAGDAEQRMVLVDQATARTGRGLEGDRYFRGRGTFSDPEASGLNITLIESEAIEALALAAGALTAENARRNVVTSGIRLNALVGKRFVIGEVECFGQRLCEPCAHLERLTVPGTLRGLVHRGGLRADIRTDGIVRVGDEIRVV